MANKTLEALFRRKWFQAVFCIFCVLVCVWCVFGFIDQVHQFHTHSLAKDFAAANEELQKSPPGIERAETFIKRLKAIDTRYAPASVTNALHDYISVMDQSLPDLKAGRDTSQYNAAMADAKRRLIDAVKENE